MNTRCRFRLAASLVVALAAGCTTDGGGGLPPTGFPSFSSLINNTTVQAAIAQLNAAGVGFPIHTETGPPNIVGAWDIIAGAVTRDQTGAVNFPLPSGRDIFSNQTAERTIAWSTTRGGTITGASQRGYIAGTSARFSVGLLIQVTERNATNTVTLCSRQMAFFYTLMPNTNGTELTGSFLAVTLATTGGSGTDCLEVGDFVFGNITLRLVPGSDTAPVLTPMGVVSLGTRVPASIAMLPNATGGFVTTTTGGLAFFNASTRVVTDITLPVPNGFTSAGPVTVSPDGSRVGLVERGDSRILVFSTSTGNLISHILPPTVPSPATFPPLDVLYAGTSNTAFAGIAFQNHRPGFAVFNSAQGSNQGGVLSTHSFNNDGLRHVHRSADGSVLVGLLNGGAVGQRARFVGLMNPSNGSVISEVDMASRTGLDVADDVVATPSTGGFVFVTDERVVHAVSANGQTVTPIEVREGTSDAVRNMACSPDGVVLLASIAAANNNANFAIIDLDTFEPLESRHEPSLNVSGTDGRVLFFPDSRVAVIVSGANGIDLVPINTREPFLAGSPVQAAVATVTANTVGVAAGGRVVAAANAAERAVYLFQLASP